MSNQTVTFQKALDVVELLPKYQQENLVETIRHRLIEYRREILAENIREAKEEYSRGEVKRGTVDDLMMELSE
jgi:cation transport regulator ChaB